MIDTRLLVSASLASTAHIVNPILALLLDQIRAGLQLLSQRHLASLLGGISKVVGENHLVDVDSGDSSFDALGQDFGDEFVGAVEDDLDSVVNLFLDGFEAVLFDVSKKNCE